MAHPAGGSVRAASAATFRATYPAAGDGSDAAALRAMRVTRRVTPPVEPLTFGTGESSFDHWAVRDVTLAAGASVTYDLATGTDLPGPADETCAFLVVRWVEVAVIAGGDSAGVRVGGAAADEWVGYFAAAGDKHDVYPGGPSYRGGSPAGKAVGAAAKNLKIENRGAVAVTVRVAIAGSTAAVAGYAMGVLGLTYP